MSIQSMLSEHPEYKEQLFCRGYLVTEQNDFDMSGFPFYCNWNVVTLGPYQFYTHKYQHIYYITEQDTSIVLIGNAVNPFMMEHDETAMIKQMMESSRNSEDAFINSVNQLTGVFLIVKVSGKKISFISDAAGMMFCAYGVVNGKLYMTSHPQLIDDLIHLEKSEYALRLAEYRFFYKYGVSFPGDCTQYKMLNRMMTNHLYWYDGSVAFQRIYPLRPLEMIRDESSYRKQIALISNVLQNTMKCAAKKWPRKKAAISLTGGMDSKTTLSMSRGLYDEFECYSYDTMNGDQRDAAAAHVIASYIGIPHTIHVVSRNDDDFDCIDVVRAVLEHNNGGYRVNANDVRKRAYFQKNKTFAVEVKSWVSEIGRANYYKKFGLKKLPFPLSHRNMTAMYKVFLNEKKLKRETERIFNAFIKKSHFMDIPDGYDPSDMYLWEVRYSAWGGMVITMEHSYSNELFIPFNNRLLLSMMLQVPLEKRITDQFHADLIAYGNHNIADTNITITNWNETRFRMWIERLYFLLSCLPGKMSE